jgi:hypothetical protein
LQLSLSPNAGLTRHTSRNAKHTHGGNSPG